MRHLMNPRLCRSTLSTLSPRISKPLTLQTKLTMSTSTHSPNTSGHFTNADTGAKTADPYTQANADNQDVPLKEKVDDLMHFCESVKFCMMTTRQDQSGLLVSRCMALAAKESGVDLLFHTNTETHKTDELSADPHVNISFIKPSTVGTV